MKPHKFEPMAAVTWLPEDVQSLKPDWTLEKCNEWLEDNEGHIQDRLTELGWEVLESYLMTESE